MLVKIGQPAEALALLLLEPTVEHLRLSDWKTAFWNCWISIFGTPATALQGLR
jgi:hypothetical protein